MCFERRFFGYDRCMVERFHDVEAWFRHNLAVALSMEQDSLSLSGQLAQAARAEAVQVLFRQHGEETNHQIANLERSLELMGEKPKEARCATSKAMVSSINTTLHKADGALFDLIALSSALEAAHLEVGVYEALIVTADAGLAPSVSELLRTNLEQERSMAERTRGIAESVARNDVAEHDQARNAATSSNHPDPWS